MKKAKTHYINFRNNTVNPKERSRNLHRLWFDALRFPSTKELDDSALNPYVLANATEVNSNDQVCRNCSSSYATHDAIIDHIEENFLCRERYKDDGKFYCFICDKHFENVSSLKMSIKNEQKKILNNFLKINFQRNFFEVFPILLVVLMIFLQLQLF